MLLLIGQPRLPQPVALTWLDQSGYRAPTSPLCAPVLEPLGAVVAAVQPFAFHATRGSIPGGRSWADCAASRIASTRRAGRCGSSPPLARGPGCRRGCPRARRRLPERATRLRVVLAEDHYLVREGTRRLLEDSGEVEVAAAVGTPAELHAAVAAAGPDVVITDIRMPPSHHMEGIVAAHRLRAQDPGLGVVVLSGHADEAYAFELLRDGTDGLAYLLKDRIGDVEQLCRAVREVARGPVGARLAGRGRAGRPHHSSPLAELTPRELHVVREVAEGRTNAGLAAALFLSESTVEKHVNAIFAKLGLSGARGDAPPRRGRPGLPARHARRPGRDPALTIVTGDGGGSPDPPILAASRHRGRSPEPIGRKPRWPTT